MSRAFPRLLSKPAVLSAFFLFIVSSSPILAQEGLSSPIVLPDITISPTAVPQPTADEAVTCLATTKALYPTFVGKLIDLRGMEKLNKKIQWG